MLKSLDYQKHLLLSTYATALSDTVAGQLVPLKDDEHLNLTVTVSTFGVYHLVVQTEHRSTFSLKTNTVATGS